MAKLQEFIDAGQAEVTAYLDSPEGGHKRIFAQPSSDLRWDPGSKIFGWWWAEDLETGAHFVRVDRIEEDDYQAVLHHRGGKVEVAGILFDQHLEVLSAWDRRKPAEFIRDQLDAGLEAAAASPQPAQGPKARLQTFEVVVEWRPTEDRSRWIPVGAWAANEETLTFAALAWYAPIESDYQQIIQTVLNHGSDPLEALAYWEAQAPWSNHLRARVEPVHAQTAREAALMAASRAEEFWLQ